jgi:sulfur-carrier protein
MARVTVHYWAAAKEAANTAEETVSADTLADALDAVRGKRAGDSRFAAVLARSSFLIDGAPAGRRAAEAVMLADESVIEVLPAFAGG